MSIISITLIFLFITSTAQWRKLAFALLCPSRVVDCSTFYVRNPVASVRDLNGVQLAFRADQERDIYFKHLHDVWA